MGILAGVEASGFKVYVSGVKTDQDAAPHPFSADVSDLTIKNHGVQPCTCTIIQTLYTLLTINYSQM